MIIYNNILPLPGYIAMNICGILFVRKDLRHHLTTCTLNHERVHSRQWFELLIIGFLLWYVTEWLIRFLFTKDRFSHRAYKHISFEQEAYSNETDPTYLNNRKLYSFIKYI